MPEPVLEALASFGLSSLCNVIAAVKTARRLGLGPNDAVYTIATDGDETGRKAGEALAVRATATGWRVSLLPAPLGRDWNDVLAMKGGAA